MIDTFFFLGGGSFKLHSYKNQEKLKYQNTFFLMHHMGLSGYLKQKLSLLDVYVSFIDMDQTVVK